MNKVKISGILLAGIILISSSVSAQSYAESALLFSRTQPNGSARIIGIGGAQIALGGDYSSALSNPAGLGMYNRSEFTITPGYRINNTSADYFGNTKKESQTNLQVPGLSFVFNIPKGKGDFKGGSIALSMTRVQDFNGSTIYDGVNPNTSLIDYFIDDAYGYTTSQFDEGAYQYNRTTGLAYNNFLLGPFSNIEPGTPDSEITYFSDIQTIPTQHEEITTKGGISQWSLSYGGNYNDKIFFGGGIGISSLRYESSKLYSEDFDDPNFNGFDLIEELAIRGSGINATLGMTFRPIDFIQFGASFVTPTYYQLSETYSADMKSSWNNFDYFEDGSKILNNEHAYTDIVTSDYSLSTPAKFSTGISFISKFGFITGDIELTNPSKAKYSSQTSGISYTDENDQISSSYASTTNKRVGAEFRYKVLRLRGGYGIQQNAYKKISGLDNKITSLSAGIGVRMDKFFADFAWTQSKSNSVYVPYSFINYDLPTPQVDLKNTITRALITIGFTF